MRLTLFQREKLKARKGQKERGEERKEGKAQPGLQKERVRVCSDAVVGEQATHEWPSDDDQQLDLPALRAQDEWLISDHEVEQAEEREREQLQQGEKRQTQKRAEERENVAEQRQRQM